MFRLKTLLDWLTSEFARVQTAVNIKIDDLMARFMTLREATRQQLIQIESQVGPLHGKLQSILKEHTSLKESLSAIRAHAMRIANDSTANQELIQEVLAHVHETQGSHQQALLDEIKTLREAVVALTLDHKTHAEAQTRMAQTLIRLSTGALKTEKQRADSAVNRMMAVAMAQHQAPSMVSNSWAAQQQLAAQMPPPATIGMEMFEEVPPGDPEGYTDSELSLGDSYSEELLQVRQDMVNEVEEL